MRPSTLLDPHLLRSAARTWGRKGLVRRVRYEGLRRLRDVEEVERRWLTHLDGQHVGLVAASLVPATAPAAPPVGRLTMYGRPVDLPVPPPWHRHPVTGHEYDPDVHWSALRDDDVAAGDVKDPWELSRLSWLSSYVRAARADADGAAAVAAIVDEWRRANPPFRGVGWMCGQESSLRGIAVLFAALALPDDRLAPVAAQLTAQTVGRVRPTLDYALSQRNNHAISEAAFLWTAAALVDGLPERETVRADGAAALTEAVDDQFLRDGSYAQHSPTYQRLATHALLWCHVVARLTGRSLPAGVLDAIERSQRFLEQLIVPGSAGRVPNLGANDGAHLFQLTGLEIGDFRPVVVHAALALGRPTLVPPGPWDEEAAWFGLHRGPDSVAPVPRAAAMINTHALRAPGAYAALRAGPLRHRPSHADQLHADVWIGGAEVAVDAGTFRYTAPPPWGNALAGEDVHNLPVVAGAPQAERLGRFFWRRWIEAEVLARATGERGGAVLAQLRLGSTSVRRLVVVLEDLVVVVDEADDPEIRTRWNLVGAPAVEEHAGLTLVGGPGWSARFEHGGNVAVSRGDDADPAAGWRSVTYADREPLTALRLWCDDGGRLVSAFGVTPALAEEGAARFRAQPLWPLRSPDLGALVVSA